MSSLLKIEMGAASATSSGCSACIRLAAKADCRRPSVGTGEGDWFVNVALNGVCRDTRAGGKELTCDLSLTRSVKGDMSTPGFGVFFLSFTHLEIS